MTEFRCICCGETKESENACSCPVCGYRMFESPYDRKKKLISEVETFFSRLEVNGITGENLIFEGKDKADKRFPDYDKILRYVTGRERTEDFLDNLIETTRELKKHFGSRFFGTYNVSFDKIDQLIGQYDGILFEASNAVIPETDYVLETIRWTRTTLNYSETPDPEMKGVVNELFDLIDSLADKIVKFIKKNNIYGNIHKYQPDKQDFSCTDKTDYQREFNNTIDQIKGILEKRYIIDIEDDGSDILKEMLTSLWRGIDLIMSAPLFVKTYEYLTEDGTKSEVEFLKYINEVLSERYTDFNSVINLPVVLDKKSEDELFELYNELIRIDKFGFLVPRGNRLIKIGESEKKLNEMIGLREIKESVRKIKAYALSNKGFSDLNIHMCFLGNPGTGKTEVARCIAGILYENRILPTDHFVEVDRNGLVSQYFGATAEKTSKVISEAMGGVLFIDEAYSLFNSSVGQTDYGKEAIDTLVKAMEDHRGKFCVIFAGYKNEMMKTLSANPGFMSRIPFVLDFPNYSREELGSILDLMLRNKQYFAEDYVKNRMLDIIDFRRKDPNFANAREVRNILEQVILCQNLRVGAVGDKEIGLVDVNKYINDAKIKIPTVSVKQTSAVLSGEEELDRLIGLENVKRMVKKIKAYAKRNKETDDFNLHMCFYGNPGTGKTEVARIISRILYDAGVLGEAKLVETDARGLIGQYVGETAPKTEAKINEAMNGVLFIDEAYCLINSSTDVNGSHNYGEEAITVLMKEMEDKRGQFCTILAGYKEQMENLISANPGFESRIQFTLDFPDYSRDELKEICLLFLNKKHYEIEEDALSFVLDIADYYRNKPNFANARTVRKILDQVILNQNLRAEDEEENKTIIFSDVNDYVVDEKLDFSGAK